MRNAKREETTRKPKLEEARRRWGMARVLTGSPTPKHPAPTAPAAAVAIRRAA